jgi:hypothetical protein
VAEEEKVNINGVNNTLTILPHPTSNMQNAQSSANLHSGNQVTPMAPSMTVKP